MKVRVARSKIHGMGVFARESVGAGWLIAVCGGEIISDPNHLDLHSEKNLIFRDSRGRSWVYRVKVPWRLLNHSDDPNCELDGPHLYALRRISPGMELTIDYGRWDPSERPLNARKG